MDRTSSVPILSSVSKWIRVGVFDLECCLEPVVNYQSIRLRRELKMFYSVVLNLNNKKPKVVTMLQLYGIFTVNKIGCAVFSLTVYTFTRILLL